MECKASRKDRTYHRVQIVLYKILVTRLMITQPLVYHGVTVRPEDIESVIVRMDADTNSLHDIFALTPLDLEMKEADVLRLLAENGPSTRLLQEDIENIPYQIDGKCDECALNIHCLPESARLRRIELLGADPSTVRALASIGIQTLDDLAEIEMSGAAARQVRSDAGFNENLEVLKQKAQARRSTLPGNKGQMKREEAIPLANPSRGQRPTHEIEGQRLIRVYLSVDYDYAENRVGAVTAHVTNSERPLSKIFQPVNGSYRPHLVPVEQWKTGEDAAGKSQFEQRDLQGESIVGAGPFTFPRRAVETAATSARSVPSDTKPDPFCGG